MAGRGSDGAASATVVVSLNARLRERTANDDWRNISAPTPLSGLHYYVSAIRLRHLFPFPLHHRDIEGNISAPTPLPTFNHPTARGA